MSKGHDNNFPADAVDTPLTLTLHALNRRMLSLVGGKAANLGELFQVGLPAPQGFCITTVAYTQLADATKLAPLLSELAALPRDNMPSLERLAGAIRAPARHATASLGGTVHELL